MNEEFVFDEMTENDLDNVLDIEKSSFKSPWSRDLFLRELKLDFSFCLVIKKIVERKKRVVAYIVFWIIADELYLLDLAVHRCFRGMGLAGRLVERSIRAARSGGCVRALLEVRKDNFIAIKIYKSFDFKVTGSRTAYYSDGEDALLMSRNINQLTRVSNDG